MRFLCLLSVLSFCLASVVMASKLSLSDVSGASNTVSVSGFSSGGFMAVQMHVAFSSRFVGAAIFAGGPYHCAEGSITTAELACMNALPSPPDAGALASFTTSAFQSGTIDDPSNLKDQKVFMFSGTSDTTVKQAVMDSLYSYYTNFLSSKTNIQYENTMSAAHVFPTDNAANSNPCWLSMSPYLSNCNYDGAGAALNQIYNTPSLSPRNTGTLNGTVISYAQANYLPNGTAVADLSLGDTGYAFIPAQCAGKGTSCKVHLALHGCEEYAGDVGTVFVTNSGYNAWADTNNIIVLYPQTNSASGSNPNGCWDWWGFLSNDSNYDAKAGAQMQFLITLIDSVTGGAPNKNKKVAVNNQSGLEVAWE